MCIISIEPKGLRNEKKTLERMELCNDDGMGFAFSTGKRVIIKKYRDFDKFYRNYSQCKNLYGGRSAFMIHFRIKTHGTNKGVFNVHPFRVNKELVFSHNGTIQGVGDSAEKSDTRLFNESILRRLNGDFLKDKTQRKLIEAFIGYSKLAFINLKGGYDILNESKGVWSEGMWYSNKTFEVQKVQTFNYGYGGGGYYPPKYYKPVNPVTPPKSMGSKAEAVKLHTCEWCNSNAKVKAVGIRWMKGSPIEWERMCIECERSARNGGGYSFHY